MIADVKDIMQQIFKNSQRIRLESNLGDGNSDILVDFQGSSDTPVVVLFAAQNQDAGVANNVGAFLCSTNSQKPGAKITGAIPQSLIGTLLGFDGSTGVNWGAVLQNFQNTPIIIPANGFLRFCTFLGASAGFPAAGSSFRIDMWYSNLQLCDCA